MQPTTYPASGVRSNLPFQAAGELATVERVGQLFPPGIPLLGGTIYPDLYRF